MVEASCCRVRMGRPVRGIYFKKGDLAQASVAYIGIALCRHQSNRSIVMTTRLLTCFNKW